MVCFLVFLSARRQILTQTQSESREKEPAVDQSSGAPSLLFCAPGNSAHHPSPAGSHSEPWSVIWDGRLSHWVQRYPRQEGVCRHIVTDYTVRTSPAINSRVYSRTAHTFFWNIIMIKNEGLSPEHEIAWHLDSRTKVKYLNICK